jgi:hypothetical protein
MKNEEQGNNPGVQRYFLHTPLLFGVFIYDNTLPTAQSAHLQNRFEPTSRTGNGRLYTHYCRRNSVGRGIGRVCWAVRVGVVVGWCLVGGGRAFWTNPVPSVSKELMSSRCTQTVNQVVNGDASCAHLQIRFEPTSRTGNGRLYTHYCRRNSVGRGIARVCWAVRVGVVVGWWVVGGGRALWPNLFLLLKH